MKANELVSEVLRAAGVKTLPRHIKEALDKTGVGESEVITADRDGRFQDVRLVTYIPVAGKVRLYISGPPVVHG